jgi:hypothetical protein
MNDDPKFKDITSVQLVWSADGLIFSRPGANQAFNPKAECGKKPARLIELSF